MSLKDSLRLFKPKKELFYTLTLDVVTFLILFMMIFSFGKILNTQAYALSEGKSVEEIKAQLISGPVENSQQFAENMRNLALTLIFGIIFVSLAGLFLFSLSQAMIWYKLLGKKIGKINYWKWNVIIIVCFVMVLIYLLLYALLLTVLKLFIPEQGVWLYVISVINMLFMLLIIWIFMLINYNFAQKYKVWESIGDAFKSVKTHWNKLWKNFILSFVILLILEIILAIMGKLLVKTITGGYIMLIINLLVLFTYISWIRIYLIRKIK